MSIVTGKPLTVLVSAVVILVVTFIHIADGLLYHPGGSLQANTFFRYADSPIVVLDDLFVLDQVQLTVEAGTTVQFAPRKKLTIRGGRLIAQGTQSQRIVFTAASNTSISGTLPAPGQNVPRDIRLVWGAEPREGELQLLVNSKWRSVCSNSFMWTKTDSRVACQQLGFADGNFTFRGVSLNNTYFVRKNYMLIQQPSCSGNESRLVDCPGTQAPYMAMSSVVCDSQQLVGLFCWGAGSMYSQNWKGIEMWNTSVSYLAFGSGNTTVLNVSDSVIQYVDVMYAGVNVTGHNVAALSASPYVPVLNNVRFMLNAYDAVNYSYIKSPSLFTDCVFLENRGNGLNISTGVGSVYLTRVVASGNGGDGAQIKYLNYAWQDAELFWLQQLLCQASQVPASPNYPLFVRATAVDIQYGSYLATSTCSNVYTAAYLSVFTVSLSFVYLDPAASAAITITDVVTNRVLAVWWFDQITYYQGISSDSNQIRITMTWYKPQQYMFCPQYYECVRIVMLLSVGPTIQPELTVVQSNFTNNVMHGLEVIDMFTYAYVNASLFQLNQFDAGLKFLNGSGDILVNASRFLQNEDSGLNISYTGGYKVINASLFSANRGFGAVLMDVDDYVWRTRENVRQRADLFMNVFELNEKAAVRFSNSCYSHLNLINSTSFNSNEEEGVQLWSCQLYQVPLRYSDLQAKQVRLIANYIASIAGTLPDPNDYSATWPPKWTASLLQSPYIPPLTLQVSEMTNFTIAFSSFDSNGKDAVWVVPITQVNGTIRNSTFTRQQFGTITMDNSDNLIRISLYGTLAVYYDVNGNTFTANRGNYVLNMRLSQGAPYQSVTVRYNTITGNNIIGSYSGDLQPRARARGVVVVSSQNVAFIRNWLQNPNSTYEIATQLQAGQAAVNVSINYWGDLSSYWGATDWTYVYTRITTSRIFDSNNRYTLAQLVYWPVITNQDLQSNFFSSLTPTYRLPFFRGSVLGGTVDPSLGVVQTITPGVYTVDRDISVPYAVTLNIAAGVKLYAVNSVGLQVQGQLNVNGASGSSVVFDVLATPTMINNYASMLGSSRVTAFSSLSSTATTTAAPNATNTTASTWSASVKIYGDPNPTQYPLEGLAMVQVNGQWGTICNRAFSIKEAVVFCGMLGLTAQPVNWLGYYSNYSQFVSASFLSSVPVQMSTVRCMDWSQSLFDCEYDGPSDQNCPHTLDVYIKCYPPGWAGVRYVVSAQPSSILSNVVLNNAGMFDYELAQYSAALQLDYNRHSMQSLLIQQSRGDGLKILFANPFNVNSLTSSNVTGSLQNGVLLTSTYLNITNSLLVQNNVGLQYNPELTQLDAYVMRNLMTNMIDLISYVNRSCSVQSNGWTYLYISANLQNETSDYFIELRVPSTGFSVVLQLLDYSPVALQERVLIYDSSLQEAIGGTAAFWWRVPEDLTQMPFVSTSSAMTIRVTTSGFRSGRFTAVAQGINFQSGTPMNPGMIVTRNFFQPAWLMLRSCTVSMNSFAFVFKHYNDPSDLVFQRETLFFRHQVETIELSSTTISGNTQGVISIPSISRFSTDNTFDFTYFTNFSFLDYEATSKFATIRYTLSDCDITGNGGLIIAEHNHVVYANNVYQWNIVSSRIRSNGPNAVFIVDFPYLSRQFNWRFQLNMNHSFSMNSSIVQANEGFRMSIRGYFAFISMYQNTFQNNDCDNNAGVLELYGIEKQYTIASNGFEQNINCLWGLRTSINSHSDLAYPITGTITLNEFDFNTCAYPFPVAPNGTNVSVSDQQLVNALIVASRPTCYSIGVFGLQGPTVTRNLFNDPAFSHDLIGGYANTYDLSTGLNATMNWWSSTDPLVIATRIFDLNEWSSYAAVDFSYYLADNSFVAPIVANSDPLQVANAQQTALQQRLASSNTAYLLGGRITSSMRLAALSRPYVITTDITVMPGAILSVDAGAQFEIFPHAGMLVLGKLAVSGSPYKPVRFAPVSLPTLRTMNAQGLLPTTYSGVQQANIVPSGKRRRKRQSMTLYGYPSMWTPDLSMYTTTVFGRIGLNTASVRLVGGNANNEGFLEFFNTTSSRWGLMCDEQFSDQVAQVVCSELNGGQFTVNALYRFSKLFDSQVYGYNNAYLTKEFWTTSYACSGTESSLDQCQSRFNYFWALCAAKQDYVFLRCNSNNLPYPNLYWGNIRFGKPQIEYSWQPATSSTTGALTQFYNANFPQSSQSIGSVYTNEIQSEIFYANIIGGGFLHGLRVSALQSVYETPNLQRSTLTQCAWNGVDYAMPNSQLAFFNNTAVDNLGYALGVLVLNGQSDSAVVNQFRSLSDNVLPFETYGFLDMCDSQKTIQIQDRLILFYKYSFEQQQPTQLCTKLFLSKVRGKQIGIRFLQLNLLYYPYNKDAIELFNGQLFNTTQTIAIIVPSDPNAAFYAQQSSLSGVQSATNQPLVNPVGQQLQSVQYLSKEWQNYLFSQYLQTISSTGASSVLEPYMVDQEVARTQMFTTSPGYDTLGVHMYASVGKPTFGFIAEVVTLPVSSSAFPDYGVEVQHQVRQSLFQSNQNGAIRYSNVGESNPPFEVYFNQFMLNGARLLNMSSPPVLDLFLQNMNRLTISNNHLGSNAGGVRAFAYASAASTSMRANVTNNVFTNGTCGEQLHIEGDSFEQFFVAQNWFVDNNLDMYNLIAFNGVYVNFTQNGLTMNVAGSQLNVTNDDSVSQPNIYTWNGIYDNYATNWTHHSTIFAMSSKHSFANNFFFNVLNDLELQTSNMTIINTMNMYPGNLCPQVTQDCLSGWVLRLEMARCVCYRQDAITARQNWWGFNSSFYVSGRILSQDQNPYLIPVDYSNYSQSNQSVIQGLCPPTWSLNDQRCFKYMGGPLNYYDAKALCESQGALLADAKNSIAFLTNLMQSSQNNYALINLYAINTRAWIFSNLWYVEGCPVVRNYFIETFDCSKPLPYFCEHDPYLQDYGIDWLPLILVIVFMALAILALVILAFIGGEKSDRRQQERTIRRHTVRASVRNANAAAVARSKNGTSVGAPSVAAPVGSTPSFGSRPTRPMPTVASSVRAPSVPPHAAAALAYSQMHSHTMLDDSAPPSSTRKAGSVASLAAASGSTMTESTLTPGRLASRPPPSHVQSSRPPPMQPGGWQPTQPGRMPSTALYAGPGDLAHPMTKRASEEDVAQPRRNRRYMAPPGPGAPAQQHGRPPSDLAYPDDDLPSNMPSNASSDYGPPKRPPRPGGHQYAPSRPPPRGVVNRAYAGGPAPYDDDDRVYNLQSAPPGETDVDSFDSSDNGLAASEADSQANLVDPRGRQPPRGRPQNFPMQPLGAKPQFAHRSPYSHTNV